MKENHPSLITATWDTKLLKCNWALGTSGHCAMTFPCLFWQPDFPFHQLLGFHYSRKLIVERWWVKIMLCRLCSAVCLSLSVAFPLLFQGHLISKNIHISAFPWNFWYYFRLYHEFLILRCFLLPKKAGKPIQYWIWSCSMTMASISVSVCSTLPLTVSSLPSLISFIHWTEGYILTHFYQNKYFQTLSHANLFLSKQEFKIRHKLFFHILVYFLTAGAGLGYTFIIFPFEYARKRMQNEAGQPQQLPHS